MKHHWLIYVFLQINFLSKHILHNNEFIDVDLTHLPLHEMAAIA